MDALLLYLGLRLRSGCGGERFWRTGSRDAIERIARRICQDRQLEPRTNRIDSESARTKARLQDWRSRSPRADRGKRTRHWPEPLSHARSHGKRACARTIRTGYGKIFKTPTRVNLSGAKNLTHGAWIAL